MTVIYLFAKMEYVVNAFINYETKVQNKIKIIFNGRFEGRVLDLFDGFNCSEEYPSTHKQQWPYRLSNLMQV